MATFLDKRRGAIRVNNPGPGVRIADKLLPKIRDTGRTLPRIDPDKVATALGVGEEQIGEWVLYTVVTT